MNLEKALEVLQNVNSVCPKCKGSGLVKKTGSTLLCENCSGKGYHTFEELLSEIEESRESEKTGKK